MKATLSRLWYDIKRLIPRFGWMFAVAMGVYLVSIRGIVHQSNTRIEQVFMYIMGGDTWMTMFSYDWLVGWLLLLLPFFACVAIPMQKEFDGRCRETLYRYPSHRSWYGSKVVATAVSCVVVVICLSAGIILGCFIWGSFQGGGMVQLVSGFRVKALPYCFFAALAVFCQGFMLTQLQMLVHMLTGSTVWAVIAFLTPPILDIYSNSNIEITTNPIFHPLNWGVLMRSDMFSEPGFSFVWGIVGQLGITLVISLVGLFISKHLSFACRLPRS